MNGLNKVKSFVFKNATPILLVILGVFVLIRMPVFFTVDNLLSLSSQAAIWGLAAIGMTMLILTGVTDMSVGAQIYLGGVLVVRVYQATGNMMLGLMCSILVCMLVSAFNGFAIVKMGLPSMITTLAMQQVCNGLASVIIGRDSVIKMPDEFAALGQSRLFNVPISALIFLGLFLVGVVLMNHTKFGRYVYAIGNNADALSASGINVFRVRLATFMITGALCGLAGTLNVSRIGGAQFGMGAQMEFNSMAAVVVGGTSMMGGSGNIIGTLLGVFVIAALDQLLRMFSVSVYLYNVFWGSIVLFTVSMDLLKKYQQKREYEMRIIARRDDEAAATVD